MIDELLTEQAARPHLEPHADAIRECVEQGWADWRNSVRTTPKLGLGRKATRASIVYDYVSDRLEAYFDSVGVPTSRRRGFLTASLADGIIQVRFKKFNSRRRLTSSGIPTFQRRAIEHQQVMLDGMVVTCVTVGYIPDELGTALEVVAIACTYGRQLLWSVDLREAGASGAAVRPINPIDFEGGPEVRSTRKAREDGLSEAK